MLCQMPSPAFFTFYKQNNNKNVKKGATVFDRASLLNSSPFNSKNVQLLNNFWTKMYASLAHSALIKKVHWATMLMSLM